MIRSALESDMDELYALAKVFASSFEVKREPFEASFRNVIASEDAKIVVASEKGRLVGYCLAFDHPAFFANGRVAWVEEIMVMEEKRRSGVGADLMAEIESWASQRGSALIALVTRRAANFYKAIVTMNLPPTFERFWGMPNKRLLSLLKNAAGTASLSLRRPKAGRCESIQL